MPAIPKWTWTIDLVRPLCLCYFLAALTSCSPKHNPAPAQRPAATTGIVSGALGVQVSLSPGSLPSRKVEGNVALLLDVQEVNGAKWSHILGADGTHGWTAKDLGAPRETTISAAVTPLHLAGLSPDDGNFNSSSEIPVAAGAVGQLIGGSQSSRPASIRNLMVPERLSRSIAPWLKLKFGDSAGFAPVEWLNFNWPHEQVASGDVAAALKQSGFTGITRAPFLNPVAGVLKTAVPPPGIVVRSCESLDKTGDKTAGHTIAATEEYQPEATILSSAEPNQDVVVEYGQGDSRLFAFISGTGHEEHACIEDSAPYIAQAQRIDLGHDGAAEWLLEVVSIYGDGYSSALWVVNGKQSAGALQIDRVALSHSSGEEQEAATDAAWWVDPGGKLWVIAAGSGTTGQSYTYQGKLIPSRTGGPMQGLVVFSDNASYDAGMQNRLKMEEAGGAAGLFPVRSAGKTRWVVAQPFDRLAEAQAWAKKNSLPSISVLGLQTMK